MALSGPRRRDWLRISGLLIALYLSPALLRAQDITPPDLWNISTGEKIPAAEVVKTKDFGAIVASPAIRIWRWWGGLRLEAGLQPGDIILAADGMRVHGSRELQLARFRNAMAPAMTLLVNRSGDLQWIKLHDLQPGHAVSAEFDMDAEKDKVLAAIEGLGLPLTDQKVRESLLQLPEEAAADLDQWGKANANADTAWLDDFIKLFSAVETRQYSGATKPAHEPPTPYFQHLEKFYLWLAAVNTPKETAPDLKSSGETAEFYTLALPVPVYKPPFGDVKFSDRRFQALLQRRYASEDHEDKELEAAADRYASTGTDGLALYLDQVQAALLAPDTKGALPFTSPLLRSGVARNLLIADLTDKLKDTNAVDWALDAYAMIALKWEARSVDDLQPLLDQLGQHSPYLARSAADRLYFARHLAKRRWKELEPAKHALAKAQDFLGPDVPALYLWALQKVKPDAAALGLMNGNPLPDPYSLLTESPYAVMAALKGMNLATPGIAFDGSEIFDPDAAPSPSPATPASTGTTAQAGQ